jgi:hypothetical protein
MCKATEKSRGRSEDGLGAKGFCLSKLVSVVSVSG